MARKVLETIRENLDIIAVKTDIDSNGYVNKSFKWIDIHTRRRERRPPQLRDAPQPATSEYGPSTAVYN